MKTHIANTKMAFEDKLVRITLAGSLFPLILIIALVSIADISVYLSILLVFISVVLVGFSAFSIRQQVIFQLRTSTNLVEAMTSGDYSLRANNQHVEGALSDFNQLLNKLAASLAKQSLISREKQILLTKITDQIDVAVVACDHNNNISLMNPAAESLFKRRFDEVETWPIKTLGLQNIVNETEQAQGLKAITEFEVNQGKRKVYVHTDSYFELGKKHKLIFITDIQHLLRDEERQAWQRLLRVLSHEINNSLTPIASISETLTHIVKKQAHGAPFSEAQMQDLEEGLAVMSERAHSLNHFIQDYQKLARLPKPNKAPIKLVAMTESILHLFEPSKFTYPKEDIEVFADPEQLQQVLVNLYKNAQEANLANPENQGTSCINISWHTRNNLTAIEIEDKGKGINNTDNLFVPYYTTKKKGSGIGLSLSRQIMLNHNGDLQVENIESQGINSGACAIVTLPTGNKH